MHDYKYVIIQKLCTKLHIHDTYTSVIDIYPLHKQFNT